MGADFAFDKVIPLNINELPEDVQEKIAQIEAYAEKKVKKKAEKKVKEISNDSKKIIKNHLEKKSCSSTYALWCLLLCSLFVLVQSYISAFQACQVPSSDDNSTPSPTQSDDYCSCGGRNPDSNANTMAVVAFCLAFIGTIIHFIRFGIYWKIAKYSGWCCACCDDLDEFMNYESRSTAKRFVEYSGDLAACEQMTTCCCDQVAVWIGMCLNPLSPLTFSGIIIHIWHLYQSYARIQAATQPIGCGNTLCSICYICNWCCFADDFEPKDVRPVQDGYNRMDDDGIYVTL